MKTYLSAWTNVRVILFSGKNEATKQEAPFYLTINLGEKKEQKRGGRKEGKKA